MLKSLHVQNFTVFADADFQFSEGLNVIVGTNGTGKSHVLKLAYAVELAYAAAPRGREQYTMDKDEAGMTIGFRISSRLDEVFLPHGLNKLVRRVSPSATVPTHATVEATFGNDAPGSLAFSLSSGTPQNRLTLIQNPVVTRQMDKPVFIPPKEMLSLMPDIIGLSDKYSDLLDLTYTGLARLLVVPLLKQTPDYAKPVMTSLSRLLGGKIQTENGRFYLVPKQGERIEMGLVAEGYRKIGTLAYLLTNGSLSKGNTLYWDEPEANLNPSLLRELAKLLMLLASQGFQIVLATHSLYLLKEFHILAHQQQATVRYFGLSARPGEATHVTMRDNLELLPDIVALDAELDQSDRFQSVLDQEDAN
jgi:energy-coupling factor transporter ATP-binding protein EcfA2